VVYNLSEKLEVKYTCVLEIGIYMKGYILNKHDEGCVFYAAEKGQGSKMGT
jgi:hypothetical protein